MSITDASLLEVGPMFETSKYDYADPDDLWVSFVAKSLGWRIKQLSVVTASASIEAVDTEEKRKEVIETPLLRMLGCGRSRG